MKFSENWLREWVNPSLDSDALGAALTMAGLEVDANDPVAKALSNVVIGEVLATERHPDADKLSVCRVSDGSDEFQVVCGAPNVRAGLRVPFARVGAVLGADFKIKQAKLRGVESCGMLCSADELGIADDADGLLELPVDAPVGVSIIEYLGLDDRAIELGLTPNRGDCLGIIGLARDVAAVCKVGDYVEPPQHPVPARIEDTLSISLQAPSACPRYVGRIIRGVDLTRPSPMWLQERLRRSGVRSIDPVVDVTNLVMYELGQPMHAFDLANVHGGIVVRMAEEGEKITLLDDSEVSLTKEHLLICDHRGPVALAGVMGGQGSAVSDSTVDVFLESAFFSPAVMAGKARAFGMHTDASHRFERGVDFQMARRAIERATELLLEIVGGQAGPVNEAVSSDHLPALPTIVLRESRLDKLLGMPVPSDEVERILRALGTATERCAEGWQVIPPSWRYDLRIEADLCEEIARVYGYDRIPTRVQSAAIPLRAQPEAVLTLAQMRRRLTALGYQEAITYSFVEPRIQQLLDPDNETVPVANPISSDMAVMRTTLWSGLVKAVQFNHNRQQRRVRLFESGQRFIKVDGELTQRVAVAGIITGDRAPEGWSVKSDSVDFYDIKGDLEQLLGIDGAASPFRFEPGSHPALHPGQCATIRRENEVVGYVGALHPRVAEAFDLSSKVFVFEFDFEKTSPKNLPKFKALSKFPEVRRDIAMVVDEDISSDQLLGAAKSAAGEWLSNLNLFDIYRGQGVEEYKKSVALGVLLQHPDRTLTDDEIASVMTNIVTALTEQCGAVQRI